MNRKSIHQAIRKFPTILKYSKHPDLWVDHTKSRPFIPLPWGGTLAPDCVTSIDGKLGLPFLISFKRASEILVRGFLLVPDFSCFPFLLSFRIIQPLPIYEFNLVIKKGNLFKNHNINNFK